MNIKRYFKYPREIYIFWIVSFILGIDFIGAILLPFFKGWGGLDQTQIQLIQSWFMFWIFILEIPTGLYGDVKGTRFSTLLGYSLFIIAPFIYVIAPNIWIFLIAEFIFALGMAFISGAEEAWMYDIVIQLGLKEKYRRINITKGNFRMLGMLLAAAFTGYAVQRFQIQYIFAFGGVTTAIAFIILYFFVPKPQSEKKIKEKSLRPSYKETFGKAIKLLNNNSNLKKIGTFLVVLTTTSYFVIWLYQEALYQLGVPESQYGVYRIALLVAEIIIAQIAAKVLQRDYNMRKVGMIIAGIVGIGFIVPVVLRSSIGVIILLVLAGGLGLQLRGIFAQEINEEIDDEQRATVLSFIGMIRRLSMTIFNPVIGLIVDNQGVYIAFALLGLMSLMAGFILPNKIRRKLN